MTDATTPDTRKRGRPPKDPAAQLPPLDPTQEIHVVLYRAGSTDRAEVLDSADAAAARARHPRLHLRPPDRRLQRRRRQSTGPSLIQAGGPAARANAAHAVI